MQYAFDFLQPLPRRPRKPERLVYMLMPDAGTAKRVDRFGRRFVADNRLPGKLLLTERFHVSIQHVGDFRRLRSAHVYAALQAGEVVSMLPFELTFRSVASFAGAPARGGAPPKRPLVLLGEGEGLTELHALLGAAMRRNGLRAAERFVPHMTLLYGPQAVPAQPIEPIRFLADALLLVHSERGLTRYNVLGRWPFGPQHAAAG